MRDRGVYYKNTNKEDIMLNLIRLLVILGASFTILGCVETTTTTDGSASYSQASYNPMIDNQAVYSRNYGHGAYAGTSQPSYLGYSY